jgi:DNA helicase-2/ATP-dependent DNA helicase PcrA
MSFKPSKFQQKIYDFLTTGKGNAVVSAVAGSGKTTTLLNALKLIPSDKSVLFLAFNKSIAKELSERVPSDAKNIHVKTVHGFGMSSLTQDIGTDVFAQKYSKMLRDVMEFLKVEDFSILKSYDFQTKEMRLVYDMAINFQEEKIENPNGYLSRVVQLCDLGRLNLINIDDKELGMIELLDIANKHNVQLVNGECYRAWNLIKLGIAYCSKIDFTDMVYLPIVFKLKIRKYDFVFIDECQDLNACQRTLMLEGIKPNSGRFVAVGDPQQAIYGFAGADSDSFKKLCALPNTIELPLSVSYRCGKNIIAKAQEIVPHLQYSDGAKDGVVDYDSDLTKINDGDMILCRQTYPIVRLCLKLLSEGRKAKIMGGDIGRSIIKMIEDSKRKNELWSMENVFNRLYSELEKVLQNIIRKEGVTETEAKETNSYALAQEKIMVIETLSKGIDNPDDVIVKISNIFSDENKGGIILSTIHKSKGLESDRVFIIHGELMPSKFAEQAWELEQEENLRYVAYTRAKSYLGFINKSKFDAWKDNDSDSRANDVSAVKESNWVGVVGDKSPLKVTVTMVKQISNSYGDTCLYEFLDDKGNVLSKFGTIPDRFIISNHETIDIGTMLQFNATIKKHREYKGEKSTEISSLARYEK